MVEASTTPAGIYAHIPFCVRKCVYCDFYSVSDLTLKPVFLKALSLEIAAVDPGPLVFDTIYIGGGTPSVLEPAEVEGIIEGLMSKFQFVEPVEVTLEANPGAVDEAKLRGFRSAGVNRLNIGVQSFQDKNLDTLGRIHSARQAHEALLSARRSGFEAVGLDLMYGLPGQTWADWLADLESALAFRPEHLACYMLTVEPETPLAADQRLGLFQPAPEAEVAELFLATSEFLSGRGFLHYEVSNFARCETDGCSAACISRHNSKYWTHAPYLGFGPSAHSFQPPRRFWNHRDVKRYLDDLSAGRQPLAGEEVLTAEQEMTEVIMLGLRTATGIDLLSFKRRFGVDFMEARGRTVADLQSQGLLTLDSKRCTPTRRGLLYLNTITAALI
ncbi:MAG: radical SAM family heme chaperone HemW [Hyphomicrobiales bacterium]